mmetsp:Transcript_104725/g.291670  ORF Transcript_104725/g.291670 Transcript_104725/m.291670 type:complete len:254 (+) Transcript_104725:96-857(+)
MVVPVELVVTVVTVVVLVGVLLLYFCGARLLRKTISSLLQTALGVEVDIESLYVNPCTARLDLADVTVGNPPRYKAKHAVKFTRLLFDADICQAASTCGKKTRISELEVIDLDVILETSGWGTESNLHEILKSLTKDHPASTVESHSSQTSELMHLDVELQRNVSQTSKLMHKELELQRVVMRGIQARLGHGGPHVDLADIVFEDFSSVHGSACVTKVIRILVQTLLRTVIHNLAAKGMAGAAKSSRRCCSDC